MNAQDVLNSRRASGVELVRFIYCDFTGVQRGKITDGRRPGQSPAPRDQHDPRADGVHAARHDGRHRAAWSQSASCA